MTVALRTGNRRRRPRPAADGRERCVVHLDPDERERAGVGAAGLRAAVCDSLASDGRRHEYVDVTLERLDLSSLVPETTVSGDEDGDR